MNVNVVAGEIELEEATEEYDETGTCFDTSYYMYLTKKEFDSIKKLSEKLGWI